MRWARALLAVGIVLSGVASGAEVGKYRFDPKGKVKAVRALDVNGDGRTDLVLLVETAGGGGRTQELQVLRTPASPTPRTFFAEADVRRIPCDGDLARAGAVAFGRFGPKGAARLRFFGPHGITDLAPDGTPDPASPRTSGTTLLARGPGRLLVVWEGHADLDRDGIEECRFPSGEGDGALRVLGGTPAQDRALTIEPKNAASTNAESLLVRTAYVPNLFPADLDGDGKSELVALEEKALVAWSLATPMPEGAVAVPPSWRLPLPFLDDVPLESEELRTPRIQLADVDGDGVSDLLVTLVTGRRDQLGSLQTTLFHFAGPFRDAATGRLVPPRVRIDTESVALHPRFTDLDGDGALDYVTDSIRGTRLDLFRRVMGAEPEVTFVGFRFDRAKKTYETSPYFTTVRPYSSSQAMSNTFGLSAWFDGDFDGDGHHDLLDLGNLGGVAVLGGVRKTGRGPGDPVAFSAELMKRVEVPKPLEPQAVVADLDGDRRADAVVWNEEALLLVVSGGKR